MNGIDRLKAISNCGAAYGVGAWSQMELEHIRACLPLLLEQVRAGEDLAILRNDLAELREKEQGLYHRMASLDERLCDMGRTDG
jgi:hypothetical protein